MSELCPIIEGRCFGPGVNAQVLRELANPTVSATGRKLKVLVTSCKTLYERLDKCDRKIFCLIQGCYAQIQSEAMKQGFQPVGSYSDSFLMIEVFGIAYPDSWMISESDAKNYAYIAIKNKYPTIIANYNTFDDIPQGIWDNINASLGTIIKESDFKGQFFSLMASTIYSLCCRGMLRSTVNSLQAELSEMHRLNIWITMTGVHEYWNSIGRTYNDKAMNIVMQYLLRHFTGSTRLANLVKFSKQYGLAMYYQVKLALGSFPNFDWAMVPQHEFENYMQARRLVQDRDYFGYNPSIGIAVCSNYPNLAYVSWKLNEMVGGQSSLVHLKSKVVSMVNTNRWDKIVREYQNQIQGIKLTDEQRNLTNRVFSTIAAELIKPVKDHQQVSPPTDLINGDISHYDPLPPRDDNVDDNDQPGPSGGAGAIQELDQSPPEILDNQNEDEDDASFKAKRPRTAPPAEDTAWLF